MFLMGNNHAAVLSVLLALAATIAGCGGNADAPADTDDAAGESAGAEIKFNAPADTLRSLLQAGVDSDEKGIQECFHATDEQKPMVEAFSRFLVANNEFEKIMIEKFGDEATDKLKNSSPIQPPIKLDDVDDMQAATDDDTARVSKGFGEDMLLKRTDAGWLLDAAQLAADAEPKQAAMVMNAMAQALRESAVDARSDDATADAVLKSLRDNLDKMFTAMVTSATE